MDRARVEKALTDMLQRSGGAALRLAVSRLHLHFAGLDAQLRALIDAVACADGSGGGGGVSGKGRSVLSSLPSLPSLPPQLLHEGLLRQYAQPDRAWQALVEAGGGASPPQAPHAAVLSVDATRPQPTRAPSRRRGSSARSARAASATVGDVVDASEGGIMLEAALQATSRAAPSSELDRTDNGSAPLAENAGALTLALLSRYAAHAGALVRALILQEQELTRVRAAAAAEGKREGAGDVQALCTRLRGQLTAARARERDLQQQLAAANERAVRVQWGTSVGDCRMVLKLDTLLTLPSTHIASPSAPHRLWPPRPRGRAPWTPAPWPTRRPFPRGWRALRAHWRPQNPSCTPIRP